MNHCQIYTYYFYLQLAGGGGGGGRVAVYVTLTSTYRGEHQTYGGKGFPESGGSGTVYLHAPDSNGNITSSLYIDNRNSIPNNVYITDTNADSGRTVVVTEQGDTTDTMTLDDVYINGDGHLAFSKTSSDAVDVVIRNLHGDLTGMIHTSTDQNILLQDSDSPIPASFRVYDGTTLQLPAGQTVFLAI